MLLATLLYEKSFVAIVGNRLSFNPVATTYNAPSRPGILTSAKVTQCITIGNRCGFYSGRDVYRTSDLSCKGLQLLLLFMRHAAII